MVPADYKDFMMAIVTASASFIGLLFVAMSFIIDRNGKSEKKLAHENNMAAGSYVALIDLFFVALVALLPNTEIGHVMAIMGILGLGASYRSLKMGLKSGASWGTFATSVVVYFIQIIYGVYIIYHSHKLLNSTIFVAMVIFLFASALGRAWELTGIREP
jgi:hypothetical protein